MFSTTQDQFADLRKSFNEFDAIGQNKAQQSSVHLRPTIPTPVISAETTHNPHEDNQMLTALAMHFVITGSYDLCEGVSGQLLRWQAGVLIEYLTHGCTSQRLQKIEAALDDFHLGTWLTPEEKPTPKHQIAWWETAHAMRAARTFTAEQSAWLEDQRKHKMALTERQQAELVTLDCIEIALHAVAHAKTAAQKHAAQPMESSMRHITTVLREAASAVGQLHKSYSAGIQNHRAHAY